MILTLTTARNGEAEKSIASPLAFKARSSRSAVTSYLNVEYYSLTDP